MSPYSALKLRAFPELEFAYTVGPALRLNIVGFLLASARAFDVSAEINDWQPPRDRQVHSSEDHHCEQVPAEKTDCPGKPGSNMLQNQGRACFAGCEMEESG